MYYITIIAFIFSIISNDSALLKKNRGGVRGGGVSVGGGDAGHSGGDGGGREAEAGRGGPASHVGEFVDTRPAFLATLERVPRVMTR